MEMVPNDMVMDQSIQGSSFMGISMAKVNFNTLMAHIIKDNSQIMCWKVMAHFMEKIINIKVIGKMVKCMAQVRVSGTIKRVKYIPSILESM